VRVTPGPALRLTAVRKRHRRRGPWVLDGSSRPARSAVTSAHRSTASGGSPSATRSARPRST